VPVSLVQPCLFLCGCRIFKKGDKVLPATEGAAAGDPGPCVNAYCWRVSVVKNIYFNSDENVNVKGYIASPALGRTSKQEA